MEDMVYRFMLKFNDWWQLKKVPEEFLPEYKRPKYYEAKNSLGFSQVTAIIGLRRIGKTTIMYQLIDELIREGVDPKRILFFSFDEVALDKKADAFGMLFDMYARRVLGEEPRQFKEKVYIFLDEIQYLAFWPDILKRYYDLKYKLKFIVTGSAGPIIFQKMKESLAGRSSEINLRPLSFKEFLAIKKTQVEMPKFDSFWDAVENLESVQRGLAPCSGRLKLNFDEYILKGGFPEVVNENLDFVQKYVYEGIIERELYKDLPQTFNIRESNVLLNLLRYAAERTGDIFEIVSLSKNFGVSRQVISNYLTILISGGLISIVELYTKSAVKKLRKARKIYVADPALASAILKFGKDIFLDSVYMGKLAETVAIAHSLNAQNKVGFWRGDKNKEVDMVIYDSKKLLPVEIKYSSGVESGDIQGLLDFMDKFKISKGIVVTKDEEKVMKLGAKIIHCLPVWMWCVI